MSHPLLSRAPFGAKAIQRGLSLPEKSVEMLRLQQTACGFVGVAEVRHGGTLHSLVLQLNEEGEYLGLSCSCGEAHCAHMARAISSRRLADKLAEWGVYPSGEPEPERKGPKLATVVAADRPPPESEAVEMPLNDNGHWWLARAKGALGSAEVKNRVQPLAFSLFLERDRLHVAVFTREKGALDPFPLGDHLQKNGASAVQKRAFPPQLREFEPLLMGLLACGESCASGGTRQRLQRGAASEQWLVQAIEKEVLFWGENPQPLRLGPPITEGLEWQIGPLGAQQLRRAAVPELATLGQARLAERWYLPSNLLGKAASNQLPSIGRVVAAVPAAVERELLALPPLPPAQARAVAERLKNEQEQGLWPLNLPLPIEIPVRRLRQKHRPVLRLLEQQLPLHGAWRKSQNFVLAVLEHEYDGKMLSEHSEQLFHDGVLILETPDPTAEQAAAQQLLRFGLRRLSKLLPSGVQARVGNVRQLYGFPDAAGWQNFVKEGAPQLEELGFRIDIEASFPHRQAEVEGWYSETKASDEQGWWSFETGILVGGVRHSILPILSGLLAESPDALAELRKHADEAGLVQLALSDGRRVSIEIDRLQRIADLLQELHGGNVGAALQLPATDLARIADLREEHEDAPLPTSSAPPQSLVPKMLRAELREYQQRGLDWLQWLRGHGLGGILADDMGLGKTLQTLAHIALEVESGRTAGLPSLVVAPTSVLSNWASEAARWAPDLRVAVLHGASRHELLCRLHEFDLVVTSYALLPRDLEAHEAQEWHLLVLDEAQNIKNHRSQASRAAAALRARHRLALSGTPLENHLGELWSLFSFVAPKLLGTAADFRDRFRVPIERKNDLHRFQALSARVRPFILRREKSLVAPELPAKTEIPVFLSLKGDQRDLYETLRHKLLSGLQSSPEQSNNSILVLDALLKLRQAATDPRLLRLKAAEGVEHNAKRHWLQKNLPEMLQQGRKVLIFSQFATLLGHVERDLAEIGISCCKLTGQSRNRQNIIDKFSKGDCGVFLISLKAGGVGLNLTEADTVIHLDPWWNPAAEAQATDRAYRIGQDRPVFVYKLIAEGTLEERILQLQEQKAALATGVLDDNFASLLTEEDMLALFAPGTEEESEKLLPSAEKPASRRRPSARGA